MHGRKIRNHTEGMKNNGKYIRYIKNINIIICDFEFYILQHSSFQKRHRRNDILWFLMRFLHGFYNKIESNMEKFIILTAEEIEKLRSEKTVIVETEDKSKIHIVSQKGFERLVKKDGE